jgi:hypothetical protein
MANAYMHKYVFPLASSTIIHGGKFREIFCKKKFRENSSSYRCNPFRYVPGFFYEAGGAQPGNYYCRSFLPARIIITTNVTTPNPAPPAVPTTISYVRMAHGHTKLRNGLLPTPTIAVAVGAVLVNSCIR